MLNLPWHPERLKKMSEKLQESAALLQDVIKEALVIERQSVLNYENFCIALKELGFYFEVTDYSWRHPHNGACASVEAMKDVCLLYPTLAEPVLKIMASGQCFDIKYDIDPDGMGATVRLRPQPLLDHIATKI